MCFCFTNTGAAVDASAGLLGENAQVAAGDRPAAPPGENAQATAGDHPAAPPGENAQAIAVEGTFISELHLYALTLLKMNQRIHCSCIYLRASFT